MLTWVGTSIVLTQTRKVHNTLLNPGVILEMKFKVTVVNL